MNWICRRCGKQMYAVVGADGPKATCSRCSQYLDCAKCSNPDCGDTKCLTCYNKSMAPGQKVAGGPPLVSQDEDI
jgi:hypothetical protein